MMIPHRYGKEVKLNSVFLFVFRAPEKGEGVDGQK
jgi:hypothetical protein